MSFSKHNTLYQSEITQFLDALKKSNPQLEQQQFSGRSLLWDKVPLNLDEHKRALESTVPLNKR